MSNLELAAIAVGALFVANGAIGIALTAYFINSRKDLSSLKLRALSTDAGFIPRDMEQNALILKTGSAGKAGARSCGVARHSYAQ
ncbi:MAG: hypothetical protein ABL904_05885 [Hyphomicrobiaceae bacterium]